MRNRIQVNKSKCVQCLKCIKACIYNAIELKNGEIEINTNCCYCGICLHACSKFNAIEIFIEQQPKSENIHDYSGICIYVEHNDGKISSIVPELIGIAEKLNRNLNKPLSAVLVGHEVGHIADEVISYGIDEIWRVDNPASNCKDEKQQAEVIAQIINLKKPAIFLGGGTITGRSLFPRIAAKLHTGLTADCTELLINEKLQELIQIRPAFGGNIMASIKTAHHRPQMATVRHKVMKPAIKKFNYNGKIIDIKNIIIPESQIDIINILRINSDHENIANANKVIGVGRGLKEKKHLNLIYNFAETIGAAVAASRPVVDLNWLNYSHQVGQTGVTINPEVYIACGISGAIQHLVGIKSSKCIIAINQDPGAPIFKMADYGIVGDMFEIIPELIKQIK